MSRKVVLLLQRMSQWTS